MRRAARALIAALPAFLLAGAALPLCFLACVDWERLSAPLPDAGAPACDGAPPDAPTMPAAHCGGLAPLAGEDWQLHPFLSTGDNDPIIGARVDQLVVADGPDLHFFCGDVEDLSSPVHCSASPLGAMDVAADGSLVVGTVGGACVVRDDACQCVHVEESGGELAGVSVVSADRFVMLVQFGDDDGAPDPVLQERSLADPTELVGDIALPEVPHTNDLPTLTRLARPCADPSTWAVAASFPVSGELFTLERHDAAGGLTVVRLEPFEQGEAVGIVAAPVGLAPRTPVQLVSARVTNTWELELRRGGLLSGGLEQGLYLPGGNAGYGDFVVGPCATTAAGRVACTGSSGLVVTDLANEATRAVALPPSAQRFGDATGAASIGDDAWIFGEDFVAFTSHGEPAEPAVLRTGVVTGSSTGERVVGAPLGDRRILLGAYSRSVVAHFPDGLPATVSDVPLAIDALALGASVATGASVVASVDRTQARVMAAAIDTQGNVLGQVPEDLVIVDTGVEPLVAAVDPGAPAGTVSLWLGGPEYFGNPAQARLNLQMCRASAAGGDPDVSCTPPSTTTFAARFDPDHPGVLTIDGNWIFYAGNGAVVALELNASRDGVVRDGSVLVPVVNDVDPFAGGVTAIARSLDCLYVASSGRAVQAVHLWFAQDVTLTPLAPLTRQLGARALLTAGDDSILVGAERGRLGRWPNDPHDDLCFSDATAEPFAVSYGPVRPTGGLRWRPVFAGDALYVRDEDARVWRVPLP